MSNRNSIEIKIKKEIREYTEVMFFGLSLRQLFFSACACGISVLLFFALRPYFGIETLSWLCILGAAPFAAMGFITYNGMTAERFALVWIRAQILMPRQLVFKSENLYYKALEQTTAIQVKEESDRNA